MRDDNSRHLGIGWLLRDYCGRVLKTFSKLAGWGLAIEIEILALLEGLLQVKALGPSNFLVEDDSTTIISWEQVWCSFSWAPCLGNHAIDVLTKYGARHMVSFIGEFLPLNYS